MDRNGALHGLLTEQELKHMSRHSKDIVLGTKDNNPSDSSINGLAETLNTVFQAAEAQNISAPHRVAAWNTLCAFIDQIADAESSGNNTGVSLNDVSSRALDLYIQVGHKARPKSCKQLLTTLASVLSRSCARHYIRNDVSHRLLRCIVNERDHLQTKPSLQALSHFLNKEVLWLNDILSPLKSSQDGDVAETRVATQEFLSIILKLASESELGSVIARLASTVLDKFSRTPFEAVKITADNEERDSRQPVWILPAENVVFSGGVSVDNLGDHVLPALFQKHFQGYVRFLERQGLHQLGNESIGGGSDMRNTHIRPDLLYASLRIGKQLGLLYEHEGGSIEFSNSSILLPVRFIGTLFPSASRKARITGLSLLVTSHAMTRPIPNASLKMIRRYLHIFFGDTDANFRSEVFSLFHSLIDRLRAITMVLARQASRSIHPVSNGTSSTNASLDHYQAFIEWILRFLSGELRPTANYQRHISALKAISIVVRSGLDDSVPIEYWSKAAISETKWPFHWSIMTTALRRLLLDLLMDPFDDVRQISASILAMYSRTQVDKDSNVREQIFEAIRRAEELMLRTGRADHADGVAHLYALLSKEMKEAEPEDVSSSQFRSNLAAQLMDRLDHMLEIAVADLAEAVTRYPVHGLLTSQRYLLTYREFDLSSPGLLDRLLRSLRVVWTVTKPILCNDAPEGYVPDDFDETAEVTTKDTLSYCWRALKESSLLLEAIVSRVSPQKHDLLIALGDLSFEQLAELRHRGAFSTVAQTWVTCCVKCHSVFPANETSPVQTWYERVLSILTQRSQINTRRSAGLPALICGLLVSDKNGELVARAFKDLSAISMGPIDSSATNTGSLPQVHALNCIKDMLKNTRLREHSESYIMQSLRLAAQSLRSPAWAIRNCGLMLFRAVIDRLLGTSDAHFDNEAPSSFRLTVPYHMDLLDVILDLLATPDESTASFPTNTFEGVFPALQLLERMSVPQDRLATAMKQVLSLTGSSSWHIRDKAARTYASLVSINAIESMIKLRVDTSLTLQNSVHGALACVKYMLRKMRSSPGYRMADSVGIAQTGSTSTTTNTLRGCAIALTSAGHLYHRNDCVVTKAAYVDVLVEFCFCREASRGLVDTEAFDIYKRVHLDVFEELQKTLAAEYPGKGNAVLRAALARALGVGVRLGVSGLHDASSTQIIRTLAKIDEDACILFFEEVRPLKGISRMSLGADTLLSATCEILGGEFSTRLKCEAQRLVLDVADQSSIEFESLRKLEALSEATSSSFVLPSEQLSQHFDDQWLQLRLLSIECIRTLQKLLPEATPAFPDDNIDQLCLAIEEQRLFSEEAIARALSRPRRLWHYLLSANPRALRSLCFGLYDLLNDDDEEIRLMASRAASRVVSSGNTQATASELEPSEANRELVKFMIQHWSRSVVFAEKACQRAFGLSALQSLNVADHVEQLNATDSSLFAEEKQNLYIDQARETKVWMQVLLEINPAAVPQSTMSSLAQWVSDALDSLIVKAQLNVDGPLGWSSKPEMYNLGMQVVYGVHVLLSWVQHGIELPMRPSTLRFRLGQLSLATTASRMNPLLQYEIDKTLESAVLGNLQTRKAVLDLFDPAAT